MITDINIKNYKSVVDMTMRLSEAWVKGIIGGLPDNF